MDTTKYRNNSSETEESFKAGVLRSMKYVQGQIMRYVSSRDFQSIYISHDRTDYFYYAIYEVEMDLVEAKMINDSKTPPPDMYEDSGLGYRICFQRRFIIPYEDNEESGETDWNKFIENMRPRDEHEEKIDRIKSCAKEIISSCRNPIIESDGKYRFLLINDGFCSFVPILTATIDYLNGIKSYDCLEKVPDTAKPFFFSARENNGFEGFNDPNKMKECWSYTITATLKN